ncbi:MAG: ABC transporter permease [Candidatus Didemnitutus sp.]|nr:ABC transporter permease [Candidatus Didemnitutus sp.]
MTSFLAEISPALRTLRRAPGFTALAVTMLALGIGANVAIYSIFQSIVLNPLPYPQSDRLVGISSINAAKALAMPALSLTDFRDHHARATSYTALGAYRPAFASYVPNGGDPQQLVAALTTEQFFAVFALQAIRGRLFNVDEFSIAAPRTAILSHAAWRRHFASRDSAVGETIMLDDEPTLIIGVMPEQFREPEFVEVWLPFPIEAPENMARDSRFWSTVGRLRAGVTEQQARAEALATADTLARDYASINRGWTVALQPLLEQRIGPMRGSLLLLIGAVGLVLLVACVNLANLMLARGVRRMQELAVRLALGATPVALARSVVLESLALAVIGGTLGAALAAGALPLLTSQLPAGLVPRSHAIGVDGAALAFALGLSVLTGLVFGFLPAWQVLRSNVNEVLKSGGARGGTSIFSGKIQSLLVAGQVALTLIVLSGAALLMKSLLNLQQTDPGFNARDVLAVRISPPPSRWNDFPDLARYYDRMLDAVRQVPGVESAAVGNSTPLTGITLRYPFWVHGQPRDEGNADDAVFNSISPDFFRTLHIPLREGRTFSERDEAKSLKVCIINQALAQKLFPGESALGKRLLFIPWLTREYREVVGVVGNVKQDSLAEEPTAQIYVPQTQSAWFFTTLVVRSRGGVAATGAVQSALRAVDPTLTMSIRSMEENIALATTVPRLRTQLFALFGALALGLSAFGIYASVAFTVSQQVREFGIRMALGATPARILAEVLGQSGRLALAGVAVGLAGAFAVAQLLQGVLYGVEPTDPWVLAGLAVFLPLVSVLAALHPAWRASRLNPTSALQQE